MKRLLTTALAVAATTAGLLVATQPAQATSPTNSPTGFGLTASGYASRVHGGGLPAGSGATGFSVIGCTNMAGINKDNSQATINLEDLGTISAADTHTWTTDAHGVVASHSTDTIADVTLLDFGLGSLSLDGISASTRSSYGGGNFHSTATAALGSITLTVAGIPTSFPVPAPGQSVTVPGVAVVTLGAGVHHRGQHFADAAINAVTVDVIPTGSRLVLAHAQSAIHDGVQSAVFEGGSYGTQLQLAGGVVKVGKTPNRVMPCQGTGGITKERDIASVSLPGLGEVDGLSASQSAQQDATSASAWEKGEVASVSLAGGDLMITGITGQANASYTTGGTVKKNIHGTTLATVVYNGQQLSFPSKGALVISGVASLLPRVVTRTKHSIEVIALQVTLLDGSGATINLGRAKVGISPSGL